MLPNVRIEERVADPALESDVPDLRLTIREWVIYWKSKYESLFDKVVLAKKIIDSSRELESALRKEINRQKAVIEDLESQLKPKLKKVK